MRKRSNRIDLNPDPYVVRPTFAADICAFDTVCDSVVRMKKRSCQGISSSTSAIYKSAQPPVPFSRRQNIGLSAFDELRISGGNGVFNHLSVQLPVKAENICELCAPIDKATIGVICTGCQEMIDEGLAEIGEIPAHLMVPEYNHLPDKNGKVKETVWTEKTTKYNSKHTWWESSTGPP